MSQYFNNAVFWVELDKIKPNPFQPRREFDQAQLQSLADSIRQYGVLQALIVTRKEVPKEDGGLAVEYELIAGERRLRASKLAGLSQVPVLIKTGDDSDLMKLELAIIENIQREDLNVVDRARSFERLANEFKFKHAEIAKKVGKSREYVSNTLRILGLSPEILEALGSGKISEGHTRPLLMLVDRPEEQLTLYKEIIYKKLTVREAEQISRKVAFDKVRKKEYAPDPELTELEEKLSESLGTRVSIERRDNGGKLSIDFFSNEDLRTILDIFNSQKTHPSPTSMLDKHIAKVGGDSDFVSVVPEAIVTSDLADDRSKEEKNDDDEDLYSIKNFSL
jgi:ParB family chromosome partitioning protein